MALCVIPLRVVDKFLHKWSHLLCFSERGVDAFVGNQVGGQIPQHSSAMVRHSAEMPAAHSVPHFD